MPPGLNAIRWLPFRNDAGETIPPYSALRITGVTIVDGELVYTVAKPNDDPAEYMLNNGISVPANMYGSGTMDGPSLAACDASPTLGQVFGPKNNQWTLARHQPSGGKILGSVGTLAGVGNVAAIMWPPMVAAGGKAEVLEGTVLADFDTTDATFDMVVTKSYRGEEPELGEDDEIEVQNFAYDGSYLFDGVEGAACRAEYDPEEDVYRAGWVACDPE